MRLGEPRGHSNLKGYGGQGLFFDVENRRFHMFGLTLLTQDLWVFFFAISGLGFVLFYHRPTRPPVVRLGLSLYRFPRTRFPTHRALDRWRRHCAPQPRPT